VTKLTIIGGFMITNTRLRFLLSLLFWLSVFVLVYLVIKYALSLLLPFIAAFVFSALLHKPTAILIKRFNRIPPKIISALFIILCLVVIGFILATAGRYLVNQITLFIADVPNLVNDLIVNAVGSAGTESVFSILPSWIGNPLREFYTRLTSDLSGTIIELANHFSSEFIQCNWLFSS